MAMLSKQLAYGLALMAGLALTSTAGAADDVISLADRGKTADDALTLGGTKADLDADVLATRYYGGYRGGYGGYRGGYGGYRGGYYGGYRGGYYGGYRGAYYGGYRGAYYGGYRGYYGGSRGYYGAYYRPYYGGGYYTPNYYGATSYYAPAYSYYGYSYTVPYCDSYYGISDVGGAVVSPICLKPRQATVYYYPAPQQYSYPQQQPSYRQPSAPQQAAPQVMPRAEETYPYDGGPKSPVPMPESLPQQPEDARPTVIPFSKLAPDETLVSLKPKQSEEKKTGKWNYPAYGEKPTRGGK